MPAERYYLPQQFQKHDNVNIDTQEFHHLVHVMRSRIGDQIEIVNGQGQLAAGQVQAIQKKHAVIQIEEVTTSPKPTKRLILAQALPRMNRLDFILEKGTELGVTEFWLFPGFYGERRSFSEHQIERLQAILIAAMKQCGRLFLPELTIKSSIKDWPKAPFRAFFGDTKEDAPYLEKEWQKDALSKDAIICIGPESGFAAEEIESLKKNNYMGVKLHCNILRTDTAALTGLSLLSHWMFTN